MDFGKLLYAAHKNDKSTNKDVKCYKTKFEPPKKEIKTKTNLSANIQKYLQKRDEEERRKAEEEKRKKEELLVLRSQDRKSYKRVQTMLKRTKSANKSVMEDAIDDVNTAVTMAGPQQCDEDDYGYVSQEASAFYDKLMNKYTSMPPEEPKFPQGKKPVVKDLNAAKDRVRAALQKEEEEEMLPHKRKRKSKSDNYDEEIGRDHDGSKRRSKESSPVDEPKPKKPKKVAPPPLDFSQLLKIAEQKQFEPIKIEKKVREEDKERPMTKKQKIEYERERERMERKLERENGLKGGQRKSETLNRIPKVSGSGERKDSLSGIGRIPKKNIMVENSEKINNSNEKVNRKNSIDSERGYNNSDNARSRDSNLRERNQSRSNHQTQNEQAKRNYKFDDSGMKSNYQSEIVKHEICNEGRRGSNSLDSDSVCNYSDEEHPRNYTRHERNQSKPSLQSKSDQARKNYQSNNNRVKSNHQFDIDKHERSNKSARRSNSMDSDNVHYDTDEDHPRNNNHNEKNQSRNSHQSRNDQERKSHQPDRYRTKSNNQSDMDNRQRSNGTVRRKESHVTESGGNYSDDEHPKINRNQFRSSTQLKSDQIKTSYKSDSNRVKSNYQSESTSKNLERKSIKPNISISENKAKFRSHSISEDEKSEVSDSEYKESSRYYNEHKSDRNNSSKPLKGKTEVVKSSIKRSSSDSDSQSGNDSNDYRSAKPHSSMATDRYKPEVKYKSEREKSLRYQTEYKNIKSATKERSHDNYPSEESDYEQSPSSHNNKYSKKNGPSISDTEQKKLHASQKRQLSSSIKTKQINSLFEGSDEENLSDHGRHKINREMENKKPKNVYELERQKSSSGGSKFTISKANSKSDLGKSRGPENIIKPRSSENMRTSTSSSKIGVSREENKLLSNHNKSSSKLGVDRNRSLVANKEKPPSSNEAQKTDKHMETFKKPNAEEMLKKNANVWSKPCNLPPPKSNPSGLSESQLERLRQMNKKPTPLKPIDNRQKMELEMRASQQGRSMLRDERNSDGRLMSQRPSQGRPSLLQAAAAAAAARAAAGKSEISSKSRDSGLEHKAERLHTGRSSENVSSSKQSMTPSNKPKEGVVKNTRPNEHSPTNTKPKQFPPSDLRPKQFPPKDLKPKQFPPNDLKPRSFPPKDVRGRQFPPPDMKRRPNKPRRIEDSSEDEYDSEMDDFIDDGTDMDREEISQQIRSIFGYDKNKYIGLNGDDDECEESNFGQIDQEEYRSLRIGAQEDYIELMRDQAEKERKKKRKLEMMKRSR